MLPAMTRRRALWLTGLLSVALLAVLVVLDLRMQDEGGWGIIDRRSVSCCAPTAMPRLRRVS
jgi:hypothetical protein